MTPWRIIARELEAGRPVALVTIASVEGSSPREAGTRMVVTGAGFHGTIGGGTLEWQAIAEAQRLMAGSPAGAGTLRAFSLGPDLGQCCGGRVQLMIEAFASMDSRWIAPLVEAEFGGAFTTRGEPDARGIVPRAVRVADGATEDAAFAWSPKRLVERHGEARVPVALFGAGHVGRALVLALAPLPFALRWIDPRPEAFPRHLPANVSAIAATDPVVEARAVAPGTLALVMTHGHALDLAIADAALRDPDIAHVGVIGSRTKAARFRARLRAMGHADDALARFACPIGLPDLGSKAPAVIAAGIVVELLRLTIGQRTAIRPRERQIAAI